MMERNVRVFFQDVGFKKRKHGAGCESVRRIIYDVKELSIEETEKLGSELWHWRNHEHEYRCKRRGWPMTVKCWRTFVGYIKFKTSEGKRNIHVWKQVTLINDGHWETIPERVWKRFSLQEKRRSKSVDLFGLEVTT